MVDGKKQSTRVSRAIEGYSRAAYSDVHSGWPSVVSSCATCFDQHDDAVGARALDNRWKGCQESLVPCRRTMCEDRHSFPRRCDDDLAAIASSATNQYHRPLCEQFSVPKSLVDKSD